MSKPSYICNCDVIHEDIVNDVKSKIQPKDDYIQLASLFKLFCALGIAGMWEAVFGDVGVTIIAVLNAMRILKK